MTTNRDAFRTMIGVSEGTIRIPSSDNGYKALVGGGTFDSYAAHPNILVHVNAHLESTAAGRYQILYRYWVATGLQLLHLPDFTPASQDRYCDETLREQHALDDVDAGRVAQAVAKCNNIWASFPGSPYGQHVNTMGFMVNAYLNAGGTLAS